MHPGDGEDVREAAPREGRARLRIDAAAIAGPDRPDHARLASRHRAACGFGEPLSPALEPARRPRRPRPHGGAERERLDRDPARRQPRATSRPPGLRASGGSRSAAWRRTSSARPSGQGAGADSTSSARPPWVRSRKRTRSPSRSGTEAMRPVRVTAAAASPCSTGGPEPLTAGCRAAASARSDAHQPATANAAGASGRDSPARSVTVAAGGRACPCSPTATPATSPSAGARSGRDPLTGRPDGAAREQNEFP